MIRHALWIKIYTYFIKQLSYTLEHVVNVTVTHTHTHTAGASSNPRGSRPSAVGPRKKVLCPAKTVASRWCGSDQWNLCYSIIMELKAASRYPVDMLEHSGSCSVLSGSHTVSEVVLWSCGQNNKVVDSGSLWAQVEYWRRLPEVFEVVAFRKSRFRIGTYGGKPLKS